MSDNENLSLLGTTDSPTTRPLPIDMTEVMDSIMENVTSKIETILEKDVTSKLEIMFEKRIAEALTRSVGKPMGPATEQNANSMADSRRETSQQSHNGNELPETQQSPTSHNGVSTPGRSLLGDALSIHAGSETASAHFRKAFEDSDEEDQSDSVSQAPTDQPNDPAGSVDPEQAYWEELTKLFQSKEEFGPEVSSHIACAAKIFWTSSLSDQDIQDRISNAKPPSNCRFLKVKQCNKPIFVHAAPNVRTNDCLYQDTQQAHCALTSLILKATGEIRQLKTKDKSLAGPIATISETLKDCLLMAGEINQRMNKLRRVQFKPSIPSHLKDLANNPDESAEWLFGDNLEESLKTIKSQNALKEEFAKKDNKGKGKAKQKNKSAPYDRNYRDHREERDAKASSASSTKTSGNWRAFQKSLGGKDKKGNTSSSSNNKNTSTPSKYQPKSKDKSRKK